jgi:nitrite reductase/ring-hydroxylating ferredoxin subunit
MTTRYEVCPVDELSTGERKIVEVDGLSIGVFDIDGEFYALNNACPHQLAPLCEGEVTGMTTAEEVGEYEWSRDGEIIKCPWHHWAFDIKTGKSVFNPHAVRTRTYEVEVEHSQADDRPTEECTRAKYRTELAGDEPPIETYDVAVEREMIVLYV